MISSQQFHSFSGTLESRTLQSLKVGESGIIVGIDSDSKVKLHLMELGFVNGSVITYIMPTPFGDPKIYGIRGTTIALRKNEAECIHIQK